jgi:aspartyl protease
MRMTRATAGLMVCVGVAGTAGASPIKELGTARRIPARLVGGGRFMVVPVSVDGTGPYPFLLDTGSTCTMVDPALAERLRLPRAGRIDQETVTGSRASDLLRATLVLGSAERRDVDVLPAPVEALRDLGGGIRGVIGQDVLRGSNWWLDYRGKALIEDPDGALGDSAVGERLAVRWAADRPAIETLLPDGRRLSLVLDSAAESPLVFGRPDDVGETVGTQLVTTSTGAASVPVVAMGPLRLGRVLVPRLAVSVVAPRSRPEDGLLPTALFDGLYFDNRGGAVVLNPRLDTRAR